MRTFFQFILISLTCFGIANGTTQNMTPDINENTQQKMTRVMSEMTNIIGDAYCTNNNQCATVAIGAKACGGPRAYRAYSTLKTNTEKLMALAQQYKALNKKYNKENGLMSDCMMIMPPIVSCVKNTCKIQNTP